MHRILSLSLFLWAFSPSFAAPAQPAIALTSPDPDYEFFFGEDYKHALNYSTQNQYWFWAAGSMADVDPALLNAILFPELLRYSLLSDFLETKTLEVLYVNGGSQSADFSVGIFQMKPSFVEQIELEVAKNEPWATKFQAVLQYSGTSISAIRSQRIERLQKTEWQLVYACALCKLVEHRFAHTTEYKDLGALRFTAAAYNGGFCKSAAAIKKSAALRMFPYGKDFAPENQLAYPDVALDFYTRYAAPMYAKWGI